MSANRVSQSRSGLNGGAAEQPVSLRTCAHSQPMHMQSVGATCCWLLLLLLLLLRSSIFELCAPNVVVRFGTLFPPLHRVSLLFFHHFFLRFLLLLCPLPFTTATFYLCQFVLPSFLPFSGPGFRDLLPTFRDFRPIAGTNPQPRSSVRKRTVSGRSARSSFLFFFFLAASTGLPARLNSLFWHGRGTGLKEGIGPTASNPRTHRETSRFERKTGNTETSCESKLQRNYVFHDASRRVIGINWKLAGRSEIEEGCHTEIGLQPKNRLGSLLNDFLQWNEEERTGPRVRGPGEGGGGGGRGGTLAGGCRWEAAAARPGHTNLFHQAKCV